MIDGLTKELWLSLFQNNWNKGSKGCPSSIDLFITDRAFSLVKTIVNSAQWRRTTDAKKAGDMSGIKWRPKEDELRPIP